MAAKGRQARQTIIGTTRYIARWVTRRATIAVSDTSNRDHMPGAIWRNG